MIMRLFGNKRNSPVYSQELGHTVRELPTLSGHAAANTMYISIPQADILPLVALYISKMETEESEHWCRCEWIIHPDDANIDRGNCRECNQPKKSDVHKIIDELDIDRHRFRGIRKRRGDEDATCPVHTREGLVVYFFEWIFTDAARQ